MPATSTRSTRRWRFLALVQAALILASLGVPAAAFAADGDGTVTVSPSTAVAGSAGNTLTFTYTTGADWVNNGVHLQIAVPTGWSAPTTAAGVGRVAISAEGCQGNPSIAVVGRNIQVSGGTNNCNLGDTVTITYSTTADSVVGPATFTSSTRTNGTSGALTAIAASPVVTVTAPKVNTTTAITSDTPDPSVAGSAISVGVSVTRASGSATPGGTVTVSDGTVTSAPCTLSGSGATATATCSLTPSTSGAKTLTATYGGDSAFNGSSGTAAHTVNKANSTTTITSDTPDPSLIGAAVSVGVSVAAASGSLTPGGTVTVSDGTVTSAPCTLAGSGGTATATCSLTPSTAGVKTLTATYGGNTAFNGSSGTASHTVTGADGTGTVAIHWDSVGNYAYGDPTVTPGMSLELVDFNFTATANMAAGSQVTILVPAGWTPPTIADSPGVLAINPTTPALTTPTCTLPTAGTPQMAVSGSGPWTITIDVTCAAGSTFRVRWGNTLANVITAPAAGTYVFTTQSKGPGGTLTSIPAPQPTITVVKANQAALSITAPATKTYGDAPFSPTTSGGSGTGAVTFTSSTPAVCTASGSATVTIVGAGTCTVTATKAADANYNSTTSAPYNITVNKANQAALVVTGTSSPAGYGSTQTLGTTGGSGTGAVTYSTGASTACSVVGNVLTITASTGTCTVTATKAADANYNSTTSAPVSVTPAKGVLTVTPDAQSRTFGQAVPTYTYTVTGFRSGENAGNAAGYVAPTCTSTYTPATPVASSPLTITCSGGAATNYTFNTTATALLTISKANQAALSITAPATKTYGDAPFSPTTSGGSGTGAVTFTSSTPAVCTASGSATVTIVAAGTCTVTATKAADANYNSTTSAPYSITVSKANQAALSITAPATKTYGDAPFSPTTSGGSGTGAVTFTSSTPAVCTASGSATVTIVAAGTCTVTATKAADANYNSTTSAPYNITVNKADTVTVITCPASVAYDGTAQTPCTASVTGPGGLNQVLAVGYADNTDAGTATAVAGYAGDANHNPSGDSTTFTVNKADTVTVITCPASVVYDGTAQTPCTASVTGPGGLNQVLAVGYANNTDAGMASASASFAGSPNHNPSSDSTTFTISKADPVCTISGYTGVYDGSAHGASGTCVGVDGTTVLAGLDLGSSYTDVPGGTADWTFTDVTGNYNDDAGSVDITISKADPVCTISGYTGVYDGSAHGASGTCVGVDGTTVLAGLDLGSSYTDVPGGTADWTFTDVTGNYNDDAGSVDITISKADPVCTISGYTGVYDGSAHGASGTCVGVDGTTVLAGLDLGSSYTDVPGGTADWTFTDVTGNYNDDAGSVDITISKADPVCTISGYTGVYDGSAHGASGTCVGVDGTTVLAGLDLGSSYTDVPGGTADWTFTDVTGNYNDDAGSVDITITGADQAPLVLTGMSGPATYGDTQTLGTTGGSGTGAVTYTSTTPTVCTVSGNVLTIVSGSGTCSVYATKAGDTNYNPATSTTVDITTQKADPVCSISGWSGTYDGDPHGAAGTCVGVDGTTVLAGLDLGSSYTDVPGGTADWTFTDVTGNYNDDAGSVDITIGKADPVCNVTGVSVNYDGDPHGAAGSCTGVNGETLSGLDRGDSYTDVPGGTADWIFTDETGNYYDDSGSVDIEITQAEQAIDFPPPPNVKYGDPSFELAATTDSGLPITYTSQTPGVCTVSGSTVTVVGVGVCTIRASQPGNANVAPAAPVDQSFVVGVADTGSGTPETNTAASLGATTGSDGFPLQLLSGLIILGAIVTFLLILSWSRRRDEPWMDDTEI